METRSVRVGVHGRNDYWECKFEKRDYELIERAGIEHVKMMISDQAAVNPQVLRNAVEVCKRLREIKRDMDFVVRLFDAGVRFDPEKKKGVYPTPQEFANKFAPMMNRLYEECPYVVKFEILNEPNHIGGIGGWGPEADQARDFSDWFLETCDLLQADCDWASLGFPGLVPHHGLKPDAPQLGADLNWIEICRNAVERADWLGVHCYWQNPTHADRNHLHPDWGLHFEAYHDLFPDKIIEITEFGNSNGQTPGLPIDRERIAQEYMEYYQELFKYPYINSAAAFIMSSREGPWEEQGFTWREESGGFFPVVDRVGAMPRPDLVRAVAVPPVIAVAVEEPTPQEKIAQLEKEAQELRQQIGQLQQEVQRLGQQATESRAVITQLRSQLDTLRQQLAAITTTTPVPTPPPTPLPVARPPIEDITNSLPRHPDKSFDQRSLAQIQYLVIQHSVLPGDFPPEKIAAYLVEKKQWPGIGYHFYITSDGKIYQTNPLETVCYFAGSNVQYNPLGVCICFAGDFTAEVPTAAQLSNGGKLLAFLMQELHLPMESIMGHKEFVVTQSPGQQWDSGRKWKDMLLAKVREAQG